MDRQLIDALFSLYRNGEYRALAERARALLPAHPDALVLHSLLGAALVALEDYEGAVASYRKALSLEPGFAKLHNGLGIAYLRLDRLPEAIASFREAIASDAGFAPAQFNLGMCFEHLDEWTGAAAHYRQATVLDPGHVQAFVSLGDVLWELGEHAAVSECYERALAIDARHLAAYRSLMNFLERTNQHARLNEVLARARAALGPHALVRIYEGVTADIAGEHESARAILESIRIDPADAAAMHDERLRVARLVRICDRLGDTGAALAHAREANRLSAELGARKGIGKAPFLERIARRRRYFTTANVARWPERPSSPDDAPPLFIVGFPRSGTTLLDTIL